MRCHWYQHSSFCPGRSLTDVEHRWELNIALAFMPWRPCLQVELLPGPASVSACSYTIQGAAKNTPATVLAGQQLVRCP